MAWEKSTTSASRSIGSTTNFICRSYSRLLVRCCCWSTSGVSRRPSHCADQPRHTHLAGRQSLLRLRLPEDLHKTETVRKWFARSVRHQSSTGSDGVLVAGAEKARHHPRRRPFFRRPPARNAGNCRDLGARSVIVAPPSRRLSGEI